MSHAIEGYDVPAAAIDAAAKQIECAVGGGVDPEHIVVQVLRAALPLIAPAVDRPSASVAEQFRDTFMNALPKSYAKDPVSTNYAIATAFGVALQKIAGLSDG